MSHERRFNPLHLERLESPQRRAMLPPDELLRWLDVRDSIRVLDLGAGTGYFTIPAANLTSGTVYALDVEPQMLSYLHDKLQEQQIANVQLVEGAIENVPLDSNVVERIVASMVLHEVEPLERGIDEIRRLLKPGGQCLCVEWEKHETASGPPVHHRIHADTLAAVLSAQGFSVTRVPKFHEDVYALLAVKNES